jgi:hypothetical protein
MATTYERRRPRCLRTGPDSGTETRARTRDKDRPSSAARRTRSSLDSTLSFAYVLLRWLSTVRSPTNRASAIALALIPRAASLATSRSRRVREAGPSVAAAARRPPLPSRRSAWIVRSLRQAAPHPAKMAAACSRAATAPGRSAAASDRPRTSCARPRCERHPAPDSRPTASVALATAASGCPPARLAQAVAVAAIPRCTPRPAMGATSSSCRAAAAAACSSLASAAASARSVSTKTLTARASMPISPPATSASASAHSAGCPACQVRTASP